MKRTHIILFLFIILPAVFTACKSSRTVTESDVTDNEPKTVLYELASSYHTWDTYSTSGKISISGAVSFSTSMQLKMVRDKCITISIRPVLGIEMAKIYINNDSAVIVDKYHKTYTSVPLDRFAHILPADINDIQNILLSRVFDVKEGVLSHKTVKKFDILSSGNGYTITPHKEQKDFVYEFLLNDNKQMTSLNVRPSGSTKTYTANYSGYESNKTDSRAANISMSASVKGKQLTLSLYQNPSKTKWDTSVDETLSIGKSYRNVSLSEFISALKSL